MIKVLAIDSSALVRQVLTDIVYAQSDMAIRTCVGAQFARDAIIRFKPNVIVLSLGSSKTAGFKLLEQLVTTQSIPVVVLSSSTVEGSGDALKAICLGADSCVEKPRFDLRRRLLLETAPILIDRIRQASATVQGAVVDQLPPPSVAGRLIPAAANNPPLIAIGASTGGVDAIKQLLTGLPEDSPGVVITQHIPEAFAPAFAARVNACSKLTVTIARHGQPVLPGHAYISPGDKHLSIGRDKQGYSCRLSQSAPVNFHRPSVDVLFDSVAEHVADGAIAIMLTGMGKDGSKAMLRIRDAGGVTLAQDKPSSVVWGMPGEAVKIGAVEEQLPLDQISNRIQSYLKQFRRSA